MKGKAICRSEEEVASNGQGREFPLAIASGRLYVVGRDGKTAVIRVGPEYEALAFNELDDDIDASPVFVGDRLYLRGRERLYAIEAGGAR